MQKIKAWLKVGDYESGVKLYQHYGTNSFLKKQFAKERSKFNEHKLREELVKLASSDIEEQKKTWEIATKNDRNSPISYLEDSREASTQFLHAILNTKPEVSFVQFGTRPGTIGDTERSELNKKYLQLVKRKDRLYLELNIHMEEKHRLPEGFLLHDCVRSILIKHQQLTETWALIDYYQVHQKFPDEVTPEQKPAIDPEKEIALLRSSISRGNARLKKPNCRDRKKTEDLLKANQDRVSVLLANRNK